MAGQPQFVAPDAAALTGSEYVLVDQGGNIRRIPLSTFIQQIMKTNVGLATSTSGLPSGAVWNNSNVVNVVP